MRLSGGLSIENNQVGLFTYEYPHASTVNGFLRDIKTSFLMCWNCNCYSIIASVAINYNIIASVE